MLEAALESAFNVRDRNIVAAFLYAFPHTGNRDRRRRQPKIMEMDLEAAALRLSQRSNVRLSAERAFQGEGLFSSDRFTNFGQQQSPAFIAAACGSSGDSPRASSSAL